jgi:CRISPR-associated protein Csm4
MPDLTLYHLNFEGPLHLGRRGVGQEKTGVHLPSDSLFAALMATLVEAGENPDDLAGQFPRYAEVATGDSPPFLLTSAFPYAGQVRFYRPPPLAYWPISETVREERLKELKRIQFVSEVIFEKMVAGDALDAWLPPEREAQQTDQGLYMQGQALWLSRQEVKALPDAMWKAGKVERPFEAFRLLRLWQIHQVPRVSVDRIRNASNIFHTGRLTFSPGCGLWFGVDWRDDGWRGRVTEALSLLADSGLGAERAVGYGHFTWEAQAEPRRWRGPQGGDLFITLSRYHPGQGELPEVLAAEQTAYELVSVGGWLASPEDSAQRRRRLWMVAEGSVLRAAGGGPWGDLVDVRPVYKSRTFPHPIWRYGLACPVALGGVV